MRRGKQCQLTAVVIMIYPYTIIQKIEAKLSAEETFNPDGRIRRDYQIPSDKTNGRFVMSSPIFVRKNAFNQSKRASPQHKMHRWITDALERNTRWISNPQLPRLLAWNNDSLINLRDDSEPTFQAGDVVWMSFTLTFSIGSVYWAPEYRPVELVRVGRLSPSSHTGMDTLDIADDGRPGLEAGLTFRLPAC
jgi:hypothetical protein